jgi:hypothetical protein
MVTLAILQKKFGDSWKVKGHIPPLNDFEAKCKKEWKTSLISFDVLFSCSLTDELQHSLLFCYPFPP